jgi:hypothetical protein
MASAYALKSPRKQRGDVVAKTAAYTIKDSDSGTTFVWNSATAFNFTLPPVKKHSKGVFFDFIIRTAATSGTGHGVNPASVDKVAGATATAVDDKDVYFTTATDVIGDGFRLTSDGVDGYQITALQGIIAQEA